MIVKDFGDAGTWYVTTVGYPTALMAKRAWERAERKLTLGPDKGVGVLRFAPNPGADKLSSGLGCHCVAVVTKDEATCKKGERILNVPGSWPETPEDGFVTSLILRRARVIDQHAGQAGRLIMRRPEGRGAELDQRGIIHEPDPGQG
jgi:hypothetical protein